MKARAHATRETGRDGKGFTSRSEPCSSISSCQPGNVARRRMTREEQTRVINLHIGNP